MIKVVFLDSTHTELRTAQIEHANAQDQRLNLNQLLEILARQGNKLTIHDFSQDVLVKSKTGSWEKDAKVFESKTYGLMLKKKRYFKEFLKCLPGIPVEPDPSLLATVNIAPDSVRSKVKPLMGINLRMRP